MGQLQDYLASLDARARSGLIIGVVVLALATALALWWLLRPGYQLLFTDLAAVDAAEISASLKEWKVPHRFVRDGTAIEVPDDIVYDTRMRLLSAGVPSGGHVGFELFDDADFGATEFAQRVNFQRALQGEIERSIVSLPGVRSARVHLTIRRPGMFLGGQETSKASVALALEPGTVLDARQVDGIRNLVAAAVDGLSPSAVVVLGPDGSVLAAPDDEGNGSTARLGRKAEYEQRLEERIRGLLQGVFDFAELRVTVSAELNFDEVREVREDPVPMGDQGHGVLVRRNVSRPVGDAGGSTQEQVEYAHGTRRAEISRAPGRVERLSIAVLVPPGLAPQDSERLHKLVAAAVGLDPGRGDTLEIGALELAGGEPSADAETLALPEVALPPAPSLPVVEEGAPSLAWMQLLFAAAALLLGVGLGWWLHPRPRRLSPQEMEAVTGKLRDWLAEGA